MKTINATIPLSEWNAIRKSMLADYTNLVYVADAQAAPIDDLTAKLADKIAKRDAALAKANEKKAAFEAMFGPMPVDPNAE